MTATATLTPIRGTDDASNPIPFARLVRTELRKLTDTRASRWLLAAIIAATPIVIAVMLFAAKPDDLTYRKLLDYTQTPQELLLPAIGILAMTSEWSQRTGLVTFTLVPARGRVLRAKFTAVIALGLLAIAVAFAAAALANLLGGLRHGSGSWALGGAGFGELILVQLTVLVQGMAFGMATLVTPAALALYYVVRDLWSALFSVAALKPAAPWIDLIHAQSPLYTHDMTGTGWLQLLVAAAIWILVPLAIGVVRVSRTEVKSS
jgi:ABC-2 type transport system permease protein